MHGLFLRKNGWNRIHLTNFDIFRLFYIKIYQKQLPRSNYDFSFYIDYFKNKWKITRYIIFIKWLDFNIQSVSAASQPKL